MWNTDSTNGNSSDVIIIHHLLADKPKVSIVRSGDDVFEEGRSSVTLKCVADANPPGRVFWRKYGTSSGKVSTKCSKRLILYI